MIFISEGNPKKKVLLELSEVDYCLHYICVCACMRACLRVCVCVWFILFSAGSVNSVTCSRDFWGQLYPSANFYLTCTPLPELIMKMICANHLIYPAYNTFAMQIGGTANAGRI
jgi:hypothetical protein